MRLVVITVARKPCSETSVVRNVLRHGVGGLNVDACRVAHVTVPGGMATNPHIRKIVHRTELSEQNLLYPRKRGEWSLTDPQGRFPANLILQHKPGCERVGTRRVRKDGGTGKASQDHENEPKEFLSGLKKGFMVSHYDEDGTETIDEWDCAEGCPVAEIDSMGEGRSSYPGNPEGAWNHYGKPADTSGSVTDFKFIAQTSGLSYSDSGGTSRYYKQVGGKKE